MFPLEWWSVAVQCTKAVRHDWWHPCGHIRDTSTQSQVDTTGGTSAIKHTHTFYRSLTPAMLEWAASNKRFVFHKDTSLDTSIMVNKLRAVQSVKDTKLKWERERREEGRSNYFYNYFCRFFTAKVQFVKTLLDNGGKYVTQNDNTL